MTKIQIVGSYAEVKPSGFYVYLHLRKSDGLVFYVGKGHKDRAWENISHGDWWARVKNKHGKNISIVNDGMSECCALTLEKITIAKFKKLGHPLTNLTDGGEGVSGYIYSTEQRIKKQ